MTFSLPWNKNPPTQQQQNQQQQQQQLLHPKRKKPQHQHQHQQQPQLQQHSFLYYKLLSVSNNQQKQKHEHEQQEQFGKKQQQQQQQQQQTNVVVVQNTSSSSSSSSSIIKRRRCCTSVLLLFVLSLYNCYHTFRLVCLPYQKIYYYHQICTKKLLHVQQTYKSLVIQSQQQSQQQQQQQSTNINSNNYIDNTTSTSTRKLRILYCITSLNEYNTGRRSTMKGYNRFTNILVPILQQSIQSFLVVQQNNNNNNNSISTTTLPNKNSTVTSNTIDIDLYIITNYTIRYEQYQLVRSVIPECVNIQIWDNATPLGYSDKENTTTNTSTNSNSNKNKKLQYRVQSLARQHRYVIKDNLLYYDIFVNFEDDMLVQYEHVLNYIHVSNLVQQLRTDALQREQQQQQQQQQQQNQNQQETNNDNSNNFYGQYMSSQSLSRIIPGLIRVEVASTNPNPNTNTNITNTFNNRQQQSAQQQQQQRKLNFNLPTNYSWSNTNNKNSNNTITIIDPSICCKFTRPTSGTNISNTSFTTRTGNSLVSLLSTYLSRNGILLSTLSSSSPTVETVATVEANEILTNPTEDQLYFWETDIKALGIRQMPNITRTNLISSSSSLQQQKQQVQQQQQLDWVLLQGGCTNALYELIDQEILMMKSKSQVQSKSTLLSSSYLSRYGITDFWSYDERILQRITNTSTTTTSTSNKKRKQKQKRRPDSTLSKYNNNQGGWIGTQEQILEWNYRWCRTGGIVPPFSLHTSDGLNKYTVEYWSGGIQLFGSNSCNLQRIIVLHPKYFAKSLLYHTSNNKQLTQVVQHRFISIKQFWGQLNYVKNIAQEIIQTEKN